MFIIYSYDMNRGGISIIIGNMPMFNYKFRCWFSLMNHFFFSVLAEIIFAHFT